MREEFPLFLKEFVSEDPDALGWIMSYVIYVHAVDDIIDVDIPVDQTKEQFTLKTFEFAETVYTNIFYLRNISLLRPLIKMASNCYMDSLILEQSHKEHYRQLADALRCSANEVILAVVEIVGGIERRREASLKLREISWKTHHDEEGVPV